MANVIPDGKTSDWVINLDNALTTHEVSEVRNDVRVMILPACYRVPSKQYTPKLWHFGLHNRDVRHSVESERLKIALAAACELKP